MKKYAPKISITSISAPDSACLKFSPPWFASCGAFGGTLDLSPAGGEGLCEALCGGFRKVACLQTTIGSVEQPTETPLVFCDVLSNMGT